MSYIETLKNGNIPKKKHKNKQLTPYDQFMAKKSPSATPIDPDLSTMRAKNLDDCIGIVNALRVHHGVVLDVSNLDRVQAQRILDFMSGAICALQGRVNRIGSNAYLFTTNGVNIIKAADNS